MQATKIDYEIKISHKKQESDDEETKFAQKIVKAKKAKNQPVQKIPSEKSDSDSDDGFVLPKSF